MSQTNRKHRGGLNPNKYLTPKELDALIEYARARAEKRGSERAKTDHLIVHILAGAGLRAADLCNLTLQDLPGYHKKTAIFIRDGKGNVSRTVEISERLQGHISQFIREYRAGALITDPLILGSRGKPIAYRTIWNKIRNIGKDMDIPGGLYPHRIRHSFAVKLYAQEKDLLFVGQQLGHADVRTTQIYAKTTSEAARRQMSQM